MPERHRTVEGNYLTEDLIQRRAYRDVKRRAHRLNLRVDEDLYRQLREEAEVSGLALSAVVRLAVVAGINQVTADRVVRTLEK